ncbi:hypothetical protein D9M71_144370 [compost metagenome]
MVQRDHLQEAGFDFEIGCAVTQAQGQQDKECQQRLALMENPIGNLAHQTTGKVLAMEMFDIVHDFMLGHNFTLSCSDTSEVNDLMP